MPKFIACSVAAIGLAIAALATSSSVYAASCASYGKVRSLNSNTPVTVTFVNKSGEYRGVMWIDFNGQPVAYANLNPGQSYKIKTYVTHLWMFTDGPGNCVEMFMPKKGVDKYNVTAKGTGQGGD